MTTPYRQLTRAITSLAVIALPLAGGVSHAHAGDTVAEFTLEVSSEPAADARVGTVDPAALAGRVEGTVGGASFEAGECAVGGDPAALLGGAGSLSVRNCAGSDLAVDVSFRAADGGLAGYATISGGAAPGGAERQYVECDTFGSAGGWLVYCTVRGDEPSIG